MLQHLTAPRLATIQSFFRTTSNKDVLGCYAWSQAVGAGLLPVLGDFEVSLRNALHRALSQHFGRVDSFDWMMQRPNPAHVRNAAAPPLLPARHKMNAKSALDVSTVVAKIRGKRPHGYVVSPDDVVAALPFGFWEVLIGGLSHRSQPAGLQAMILSSVFPQAVASYGTADFRKRVMDLLKRIRDVRNRIGHHDALWAMPEFSEQGVIGFIPRRPRHTINSLRIFTDRVCWFAGWIDPEISLYIQRSDHWWSLNALLDRQALAVYRQTGGEAGTFRTILDNASLPQTRSKKIKKRTPSFRKRLVSGRYYY